jgi:predicted lipoprotein with Yx(FWY)xxD motif
MTVRRCLLMLVAAAAIALAAGASTQAAGGAAAVKTRHGKLGTFLVDGGGRTLYLFKKDTTSRSTCTGECAKAWPPLVTTGAPAASGSARKALLKTSKRSDGRTQVTYNGHPLYRFSEDKKAGDVKGQGVDAFGGRWYAVTPSGKRLGSRY